MAGEADHLPVAVAQVMNAHSRGEGWNHRFGPARGGRRTLLHSAPQTRALRRGGCQSGSSLVSNLFGRRSGSTTIARATRAEGPEGDVTYARDRPGCMTASRDLRVTVVTSTLMPQGTSPARLRRSQLKSRALWSMPRAQAGVGSGARSARVATVSLARAAAVVAMVVERPPVSRRVERLLQLGHALFDGSGAGSRCPGKHPLGKLLSLAVGQSLEQFIDSLTHGSTPKSLTEWIKRRCVVSRKPGPKVPSAGCRASPSLRTPWTLGCVHASAECGFGRRKRRCCGRCARG
jgi:hypothetical protein